MTQEREKDALAFDENEVIDRLQSWPVSGIGLHPGGSNYVFVARLTDPGKFDPDDESDQEIDEASSIYSIYKPAAGERPLKDFPHGTLHLRELASYKLSRRLGWPTIPPTVVREGPHGEGSFQLFINAADEEDNFFSLRDERLNDFKGMATFDVLTHNADRKGGSCIVDEDGKLWSIDHGLTFNQVARRRTVMFEFNGTEYPAEHLEAIEGLQKELFDRSGFWGELQGLVTQAEVDDLVTRASEMLDSKSYPVLDPDINVPWPMV